MILSGLYGILIVVLGGVIPLTEIFVTNDGAVFEVSRDVLHDFCHQWQHSFQTVDRTSSSSTVHTGKFATPLNRMLLRRECLEIANENR